ncbi:MAG TPA: nitrile hydratase accessory protein [Usitatibacter sp.]|nr:nitrile hydratase accessory protein [Usitatibacter sp.]
MRLTEEIPGLPREGAEPVFAAPWEAQAFAMAVALHERGAFTWTEWAATLAEVIAEHTGDFDDGGRYYEYWLTALERIVARKGIVAGEMLESRRQEWDEAARSTPHGRPIELRKRTPERS